MSLMSNPLYFNEGTVPKLYVKSTVCTNEQYSKRFQVEYDGRTFYVITPKKERHAILDKNLPEELRNIPEEKITNCVKDTFLRLGKVNNEYVIEFRKEPLTVKALPFAFGGAAAGPIGGAIIGLCVTGGPAGWCLGGLIGGGVGLAAVFAGLTTTVILDTNDVNQEPKFQKVD